MLLKKGNKVLVVHRRLFENDKSRFFLGEVEAYEHTIAKITGQTWIRDAHTTSFVNKEGANTKLIPLSSGALIVYVLPNGMKLSSLKFEATEGGATILTDGKKFVMDLSETVHEK